MTRRPTAAALLVAAAATLALPGGAAAQGEPVASDRPIILTVGESTTAGYGVPRELSYPGQLQTELDRRGYRYRVVNQGVSGSTTQDALTRLSRGMGLLPKIVIIALGGNDSGGRVPIERTRANMDRLISMYKRGGALVFVSNRNLPGDEGKDANTIFATLAAQHGAVLMPPLLSGVDGHADLLIGDGRHPNADGYAIVVRNILAVLEPYLKEASARSSSN
ncbi:MAG TPA: GDSL-type esterase/lipase family protein [Vicinamibacterales bacterium]|nr:GDSL-type esterase/lipase family protein [Vicinamibacterales bacterium]